MSITYNIARVTLTKIYNSFVKTPAVLDSKDFFPQAFIFVDNWAKIRDEAKVLIDNVKNIPRFHDLMPEQYKLSAHGAKEWRMFVVRAYGLDIKENMERCPTLAKLVRLNPNVKSASLSFLAPGKRVPKHIGPFRGITRFYLGIDVPLEAKGRPGVVLTIEDKDYRLGNGESLLWDDTYSHSAHNMTEEWRCALLLDIYRMNMPAFLRLLTNMVLGLARLTIKWRGIFPKGFA